MIEFYAAVEEMGDIKPFVWITQGFKPYTGQ